MTGCEGGVGAEYRPDLKNPLETGCPVSRRSPNRPRPLARPRLRRRVGVSCLRIVHAEKAPVQEIVGELPSLRGSVSDRSNPLTVTVNNRRRFRYP